MRTTGTAATMPGPAHEARPPRSISTHGRPGTRSSSVEGIAVAAHFGVRAVRVSGKGGVWVPADDHGPARKLGNVGTRIERGVTLYGIELHVNPDLSMFDTFTLCGLDGVTVTSLAVETGQAVTVADVLPVFTAAVVEVFGLGDSWTCATCGAWTWAHEDGACPLTA